jgi:ketosteroid isomerase-like protein
MSRSMHSCVISFALLVCVSAPLSAQAGAEAPPPMPSVTLPPALDRVLRDYEKHWAAKNLTELANLFTDDGFVLQNGKMPVRGKAAIAAVYGGGAGGALKLRAIAFATADTVGYILGGYRYGTATDDTGKFTLTLRRARGGPWLIASDMDNGNGARRF